MILVCVGATEYKLDRLLRLLDELCEENVLKGEEIMAQIGSTDYRPRHYRSFHLISRKAFQKYMEEAEFVITHAGTGSVIPLLKLGKKVILFPRRERYKEHVDDHQLELRDALTREGYVLSAEKKEELKRAIEEIKTFHPKKFQSNNHRINQMVIDFIEAL